MANRINGSMIAIVILSAAVGAGIGRAVTRSTAGPASGPCRHETLLYCVPEPSEGT